MRQSRTGARSTPVHGEPRRPRPRARRMHGGARRPSRCGAGRLIMGPWDAPSRRGESSSSRCEPPLTSPSVRSRWTRRAGMAAADSARLIFAGSRLRRCPAARLWSGDGRAQAREGAVRAGRRRHAARARRRSSCTARAPARARARVVAAGAGRVARHAARPRDAASCAMRGRSRSTTRASPPGRWSGRACSRATGRSTAATASRSSCRFAVARCRRASRRSSPTRPNG